MGDSRFVRRRVGLRGLVKDVGMSVGRSEEAILPLGVTLMQRPDGSASMVSSPDEDASIGRVFQDAKDTGIDRLDPAIVRIVKDSGSLRCSKHG